MGASPPQMSGPLGGPLARDPQRDKRYPFVRCLVPWEDPWGTPPKPSDGWHWCALAPGHEDACECTCGARKLAAGRKSETAGAKAFRKLRGQVVA